MCSWMKRRKVSVLIPLLLGAAISVGAPANVYAWTCKSSSLKQAFDAAEVVVAGIVTDDMKLDLGNELTARLYLLHVISSWKGEEGDTITLYAKYKEGEEPSIKQNTNYILFLKEKNDYQQYKINSCTLKEDIGADNGYFLTLLLNGMAQSKLMSPNFIGDRVRTPENTKVGGGVGLTDEESSQSLNKTFFTRKDLLNQLKEQESKR